MTAARTGSIATNTTSIAPACIASTAFLACSKTTYSTGASSRRPSSRAILTAMPRGLPVAGSRVAITPLPRLMPARSLPVGARSARAVAVGAGGADAHAAKKQRAASAAKRVIADFARSFVCHGLVEKQLHFAKQLHAVFFHYHRVRAVANDDEPFVWCGGQAFEIAACHVRRRVGILLGDYDQRRHFHFRRIVLHLAGAEKVACVLGRAVWRAND